MFFSLPQQLLIVLEGILFGATAALLYDLLRAVRWCCRAGTLLTSLLDGLFWIVVLFGLFWFSIACAQGQDRGYVFMAVAAGMTWCFFMVSPLLVGVLLLATRALGRGMQCAIRLLKRMSSFFEKKFFSEILKKIRKNTSLFRRKGIK